MEAAAPGGDGEGLGGAERRRGACAGALRPPNPCPAPLDPTPRTPPSSTLACAIAHLPVLEARVGPRLEQRLGAESVASASREVQRRPLVLCRAAAAAPHTRG